MTKIIHISDLHFGLHKEELILPFLNDVEAINPDIILISGDLTHRARRFQYQLLTNFLKKLPGKLLIVPGNHDIPLKNIWGRLFAPFKLYKQYISDDINVAFQNKGVRILGVNSVDPYQTHNGKLSHATRDKIEQYFSSAFPGLNLIFFHHNLDYFEKIHKPLKNHHHFIDDLNTSQLNIICTGHLHYANVGLIQKNSEHSALLLHAGTLFCQRSRDYINSYFSLEMVEQECQIDWRVFNDVSFDSRKRYMVNFAHPFLELKEV